MVSRRYKEGGRKTISNKQTWGSQEYGETAFMLSSSTNYRFRKGFSYLQEKEKEKNCKIRSNLEYISIK